MEDAALALDIHLLSDQLHPAFLWDVPVLSISDPPVPANVSSDARMNLPYRLRLAQLTAVNYGSRPLTRMRYKRLHGRRYRIVDEASVPANVAGPIPMPGKQLLLPEEFPIPRPLQRPRSQRQAVVDCLERFRATAVSWRLCRPSACGGTDEASENGDPLDLPGGGRALPFTSRRSRRNLPIEIRQLWGLPKEATTIGNVRARLDSMSKTPFENWHMYRGTIRHSGEALPWVTAVLARVRHSD